MLPRPEYPRKPRGAGEAVYTPSMSEPPAKYRIGNVERLSDRRSSTFLMTCNHELPYLSESKLPTATGSSAGAKRNNVVWWATPNGANDLQGDDKESDHER